MHEIFLSYRRADEKATTGRVYDHLVEAFGKEAIFYDVETIPHGDDFRTFIDKTIRACTVVLVVIGPLWLGMSDKNGRRLDQVNDPVRIEIETALRQRKRIIPVLVDEARMPEEAELPATIIQLARQNAAPMHNNTYFEQDINTLLDDITTLGIARKTLGPIVNPPAAGFGTAARATAVAIGIPAVFVALGLAAVVGVIALVFTIITHQATYGAHGTLNSFCTAMEHHDYTTAWSDLTPQLQQSIGDASKLPTGLPGVTTDFFGTPVAVVGCHPFDQSIFDGFYSENGSSAHTLVEFDAQKADRTRETIRGMVVYFRNVNGTWKIDAIQDS